MEQVKQTHKEKNDTGSCMMSTLVLSSATGFTLIFENKESLQTVINHLSGFMEFIEQEDIEPPYIYNISDNRIPQDEIDKLTDKVKDSFGDYFTLD